MENSLPETCWTKIHSPAHEKSPAQYGRKTSLVGPRFPGTPSQVVELGRQGLQGIVLEKGGLSSHCVILARSMGIPCIIGVAGLLEQVRDGQSLLLDAEGGRIIVEPTLEEIQAFEQYEAAYRAEQKELEQFRHAPTATTDGQAMKVYANITSELEVPELLKQGGEGVGLLRTELLYMERESVPDEGSQYAAYSAIVTGLAGRPLIVRTLDVGGAKHIPYLKIPQEDRSEERRVGKECRL